MGRHGIAFAFTTTAILALGLSSVVEGYDDYEDITEETYEDYGENYIDEDENLSTPSYEDSTVNRVKRYELPVVKTLGPEDVREVRGALKQLLSGIAVDNPFTPFTTATYSDYLSTNSSTTLTRTYDTTLTTNTIYSTITSTYFTKLLTEFFQFTTPTPTRSNNNLKWIKLRNIFDGKPGKWLLRRRKTTTATTTMMTTTTTTKRTPPYFDKKRPDLDIPKLLALISYLASEFETNLTKKLNESLITLTLPECTTPTTEPPTMSQYDANYTGSIISKCFVCGLTIAEIPQHAHCADAFSGDFLPLVHVDASARGKISRYKKYCKYSNVPGFQFNSSEPRVMMGRWTGGCSVRWVDLTGVYTQRSCRNRIQPAMGRHFASKRMAKLERALWNVENGCITSPMATLLPLSRGVSLYARFHACVCTGSWCNTTGPTAPCITFIISLPGLLTIITKFRIIF